MKNKVINEHSLECTFKLFVRIILSLYYYIIPAPSNCSDILVLFLRKFCILCRNLCLKWKRSIRRPWCLTHNLTMTSQTSSTRWTHSRTSLRNWKSKCQSWSGKQRTSQRYIFTWPNLWMYLHWFPLRISWSTRRSYEIMLWNNVKNKLIVLLEIVIKKLEFTSHILKNHDPQELERQKHTCSVLLHKQEELKEGIRQRDELIEVKFLLDPH